MLKRMQMLTKIEGRKEKKDMGINSLDYLLICANIYIYIHVEFVTDKLQQNNKLAYN